MEYIRILTCKAMTTDEIWVRILIYNDCGTKKFLNVFFPVKMWLLDRQTDWQTEAEQSDTYVPLTSQAIKQVFFRWMCIWCKIAEKTLVGYFYSSVLYQAALYSLK